MRFLPFACLLILFSTHPASGAPPEKPVKFLNPWNADPPADPRRPWTLSFGDRFTSGYVESVEKEGITLHWPERKVLKLRNDPLSGHLLEMKEETHAAIPGKRFALGKELAQGEYRKTAMKSFTYRITDVLVGDRLSIQFNRRNGVDICESISIVRRPGGRVPLAPGAKPDVFGEFPDGANAWQDWEENRTPFPRKYWPSYLKDGKFYVGPYPNESTVIVPIRPAEAPSPREVKRIPPS